MRETAKRWLFRDASGPSPIKARLRQGRARTPLQVHAWTQENGFWREPKLKPADIAERVALAHPWRSFSYSLKGQAHTAEEIDQLQFPIDLADYPGLSLRWRRDIDPADKLRLLAKALATVPTYEERAGLCKCPEELDQAELYAPIWPDVNAHLGRFGINAQWHQELVEQLGIVRYGHRPKVGDTFCGGGSIPFEAARLGCDVYASDLNPIACMLTWGALNIIGAPPEQRAKVEQAQRKVAEAVDKEISALGIEHDSEGNRAKAFLYCLETRYPETGWMVPMAPSWVISKTRSVVAKLVPDKEHRRFDIEVHGGVSAAEKKAAEQGAVREGNLVYELDGKIHLTPIKALRGDYRDADGNTVNRLRRWQKHDFMPYPDDVFQERLYCIHWIVRKSLDQKNIQTIFTSPTDADLQRECEVEAIVARSIGQWQEAGLVPGMMIAAGGPPRYQGRSLIISRGWSCWHYLFNPRNVLYLSALVRASRQTMYDAALEIAIAKALDWNSRLCRWNAGWDKPEQVFYNQALDPLLNFGARSVRFGLSQIGVVSRRESSLSQQCSVIRNVDARKPCRSDLFISDPLYGDAVMYHEITGFFIAWLRNNPPQPFDQWVWDSRRDHAIKGSGDGFRRGMLDAYKAMTEHMPDNDIQCVMFTHRDTRVWSDMVSIFWAAGLQVVGAWYIATETTSELKKGGFVQGAVVLALRKRMAGDRPGFKQRLLPQVKKEVGAQIQQMLHLNTETEAKMGAPAFNNSDRQMAGYAAALKVLTGFTSIGGEDVTSFALRPRRKGETTVVDEIVEQAAETANGLLVPDGLESETWAAISGIQRFYLRMLDMETTGSSKLDNYQNFAKAFRVQDYAAIMASIKPNAARLKAVTEFKPRDLTDRTEIGPTPLGALIVAIQEFLIGCGADKEPEVVMANLRDAVPDYLGLRPKLVDMTSFIAAKARQPDTRRAAEAIASRMRNQRLQ